MSERLTSPSPKRRGEVGDFWRKYMNGQDNELFRADWEAAVAEGFQLHAYEIVPPQRSRRIKERFQHDGLYYDTEFLPPTEEDTHLQKYRDETVARLEFYAGEGNVRELQIPHVVGHDLRALERIALTQAGIVPTETELPRYTSNAYRAVFVRWPEKPEDAVESFRVIGSVVSIEEVGESEQAVA